LTESARETRLGALRHRDFRLLWGALSLSDFGDAIGRVALVIIVFDETNSGLAAALVPALSVVPFLGPGQYLTAHLERFSRRSVLVGADVIRAACFGLMALPLSTAGRLALLLVASLAEPPFLATRRAITPRTLPEDEYAAGVRINSASTEIALLAGAVAGGLLTHAIGAEWVMVVNALTFVLSAALLASMSVGRLPVGDVAATAHARLRAGMEALRGDPILRISSIAFPIMSAAALGVEAVVAPYVDRALHYDAGWVGYLTAVVCAGVLVGAALAGRRSEHAAQLRQMWRVGLVGSALATAAFALPSVGGTAILAFAAVGFVYSCRIPSQVLYGQRVADESLSAASSLADGLYATAVLVSSIGSGALVDQFGARTTTIALGAFGVVAAATTGLAARAAGAEEVSSAA
jgi:predicted MFS family arabinose efflux permease